jgi:hypothetical protein
MQSRLARTRKRQFLETLQHVLLPLLLTASLAGCVSKTKADARARAAFFAGQQQQAAMQARQNQIQGPAVTLLGEVRTAQLPWTPELTLAKALVAAEYYGKVDPSVILIQREGKRIQWDPKKLLGGEDIQLQPGDVIELAH